MCTPEVLADASTAPLLDLHFSHEFADWSPVSRSNGLNSAVRIITPITPLLDAPAPGCVSAVGSHAPVSREFHLAYLHRTSQAHCRSPIARVECTRP